MGGYGSGAYGGGARIAKDTVESTFSINANKLKRGGAFVSGMNFDLHWAYTVGWDQEERKSSMSCHFKDDVLTLSYERKGYHQIVKIPIEWTPCNYGGKRAWFKCPGCGKRSYKLHLKSGLWACRKCQDLTYISCQIRGDTIAECDRKIKKIGKRLGIGNPWDWDKPEKPKGMHYKTYLDLYLQLYRLRSKRQDAWMGGMAAILDKSPVKQTAYKIRNSV